MQGEADGLVKALLSYYYTHLYSKESYYCRHTINIAAAEYQCLGGYIDVVFLVFHKSFLKVLVD